MRRLTLAAAATTALGVLMLAPPAFAVGGEGLLGETSDLTVTLGGLILIGFFILVVCLGSLVQWRLEERKHARDDARKAREQSAEWRGGW
ncbi:MAG TPA: hypothetical protein VL977_03580 [Solirubrobacteraceae bacterium]|nr:hypothetical protein [Solirubrobacteraceae bacterium]